ncbi:MAG: hypothetical protein H0V51_02675 [Chloroflexi bacterium]|nr:hypothetical protein [Chloroflexota bacterium]
MARSSTNGTVTGTPPAELTHEQQAALEALLLGQTVTAAAGIAGVARTTLHRWLRDDDTFAAAYNAHRAELRDAASARLLGLADKALAALERGLDDGDTRAAGVVLRGLGLLSGQPMYIGSDRPDRVRRERELAERAQGHEDWMAEVTHSLPRR